MYGQTSISYSRTKEGNDCLIYQTFTYHRGYIVEITSYSSDESLIIGKSKARDFYKNNKNCGDEKFIYWIERIILEYE